MVAAPGPLSTQLFCRVMSERELNTDNFQIGERVYVRSFRAQGEVCSGPDRQGNYSIRVGVVRVKIGAEHLEKSRSNKKKSIKTSAPFESSNENSSGTIRVDLHGLTRIEANELLISALDRALLDNADRIEVVHGLGDGIMKRTTESFSKGSKHVVKFTAHPTNPGVSYLELK